MAFIKKKILNNHRLGSITGAFFFSLWIFQRFYFHYVPTFLWWLITFQFSLFIVAYLTRFKATAPAKGFKEIIFPFICAAMPFGLADFPFKPPGIYYPVIAPFCILLMFTGTIIIIFGIFSLRKSFSIMAEVRKPVVKGIYRYCRHPMYLGSIIASAGCMLINISIVNIVIFLVFCILQITRAQIEEKKISTIHTEYLDYAANTGWAWKIGVSKQPPN